MVCERPHPTQFDRPPRFRAALPRDRPVAVLVLLPIGLGLAATVVATSRRLTRVVVAGESMLPSLRAGDRLLVVPFGRLRPGDVVALPDPRQPGRMLVKRVRSVGSGLVDVRGDNEAVSTDSRHFGPLPLSSVTGRVAYRYAPAGRVGRLRG